MDTPDDPPQPLPLSPSSSFTRERKKRIRDVLRGGKRPVFVQLSNSDGIEGEEDTAFHAAEDDAIASTHLFEEQQQRDGNRMTLGPRRLLNREFERSASSKSAEHKAYVMRQKYPFLVSSVALSHSTELTAGHLMALPHPKHIIPLNADSPVLRRGLNSQSDITTLCSLQRGSTRFAELVRRRQYEHETMGEGEDDDGDPTGSIAVSERERLRIVRPEQALWTNMRLSTPPPSLVVEERKTRREEEKSEGSSVSDPWADGGGGIVTIMKDGIECIPNIHPRYGSRLVVVPTHFVNDTLNQDVSERERSLSRKLVPFLREFTDHVSAWEPSQQTTGQRQPAIRGTFPFQSGFEYLCAVQDIRCGTEGKRLLMSESENFVLKWRRCFRLRYHGVDADTRQSMAYRGGKIVVPQCSMSAQLELRLCSKGRLLRPLSDFTQVAASIVRVPTKRGFYLK